MALASTPLWSCAHCAFCWEWRPRPFSPGPFCFQCLLVRDWHPCWPPLIFWRCMGGLLAQCWLLAATAFLHHTALYSKVDGISQAQKAAKAPNPRSNSSAQLLGEYSEYDINGDLGDWYFGATSLAKHIARPSCRKDASKPSEDTKGDEQLEVRPLQQAELQQGEFLSGMWQTMAIVLECDMVRLPRGDDSPMAFGSMEGSLPTQEIATGETEAGPSECPTQRSAEATESAEGSATGRTASGPQRRCVTGCALCSGSGASETVGCHSAAYWPLSGEAAARCPDGFTGRHDRLSANGNKGLARPDEDGGSPHRGQDLAQSCCCPSPSQKGAGEDAAFANSIFGGMECICGVGHGATPAAGGGTVQNPHRVRRHRAPVDAIAETGGSRPPTAFSHRRYRRGGDDGGSAWSGTTRLPCGRRRREEESKGSPPGRGTAGPGATSQHPQADGRTAGSLQAGEFPHAKEAKSGPNSGPRRSRRRRGHGTAWWKCISHIWYYWWAGGNAAPWQGSGLSRAGFPEPIPDRCKAMAAPPHSIYQEQDFVPPFLAQLIAINLTFELALDEIGPPHRHTFCTDPRLPVEDSTDCANPVYTVNSQDREFEVELPALNAGQDDGPSANRRIASPLTCSKAPALVQSTPQLSSPSACAVYHASDRLRLVTVTGEPCSLFLHFHVPFRRLLRRHCVLGNAFEASALDGLGEPLICACGLPLCVCSVDCTACPVPQPSSGLHWTRFRDSCPANVAPDASANTAGCFGKGILPPCVRLFLPMRRPLHEIAPALHHVHKGLTWPSVHGSPSPADPNTPTDPNWQCPAQSEPGQSSLETLPNPASHAAAPMGYPAPPDTAQATQVTSMSGDDERIPPLREALRADVGPCVILLAQQEPPAASSGFWLPPSLSHEDVEGLANAGAAYGRYAFYDLVDHARVRDFHPGWTLVDAWADR